MVESDMLDFAIDGNAIVVPQHDQMVELEVTGQRDGFLGNAFHEAAVARQHIGFVVDEIIAETCGQMALGDGEADRVGKPWPSGPVVVSMPAAWPYSGWPAVLEPSCRKLFQVLDGHVL